MAKRQKWGIGDVFTVPLTNQTYSIGQVVYVAKDALDSAVCAFFDIKLGGECIKDADIPKFESNKLVSMQFSTVDCLKSGRWCIRTNRAPFNVEDYLNIDQLRDNRFVGVEIRGCGNLTKLMDAFYKLIPWDSFYDPKYLDTLLVSQDKKPCDVLLKPISDAN